MPMLTSSPASSSSATTPPDSHSEATKLDTWEFLFAHLIERGFDTVVNINHYHSNQARFVAASCAKRT